MLDFFMDMPLIGKIVVILIMGIAGWAAYRGIRRRLYKPTGGGIGGSGGGTGSSGGGSGGPRNDRDDKDRKVR